MSDYWDDDDYDDSRRVKFIQRSNNENENTTNRINYCASFVYDPVKVAYTMCKNEELQKKNNDLKNENYYLNNYIRRIENQHKREYEKMNEERKKMELIKHNAAVVINSRVEKMKEEWEERNIRIRMEEAKQKREEREEKRRKEAADKHLSNMCNKLYNRSDENTIKEMKHQQSKDEMRNYIEKLNAKKKESVISMKRIIDSQSKRAPWRFNFIIIFALIMLFAASYVLYSLIYDDEFL